MSRIKLLIVRGCLGKIMIRKKNQLRANGRFCGIFTLTQSLRNQWELDSWLFPYLTDSCPTIDSMSNREIRMWSRGAAWKAVQEMGCQNLDSMGGCSCQVTGQPDSLEGHVCFWRKVPLQVLQGCCHEVLQAENHQKPDICPQTVQVSWPPKSSCRQVLEVKAFTMSCWRHVSSHANLLTGLVCLVSYRFSWGRGYCMFSDSSSSSSNV